MKSDVRRRLEENFASQRDIVLANALRNEPYLRNSKPIRMFEGRGSGPAVVFGAGPSLSESLRVYVHHPEMAMTVCTDRALRRVIQDLTPMFTVAVSCEENVLPDMLDFLTIPFLVFDPYVSTRVIERSGALRWITYDRPPFVNGAGTFPFGTFVGFYAVAIAAYMGHSPIILAGMDMAFQGNETHDAGTVRDEFPEDEIAYIDSVTGGEVRTDIRFAVGVEELEEAIDLHGWDLIQTSPFGALIKGARHMSMHAALDSVV